MGVASDGKGKGFRNGESELVYDFRESSGKRKTIISEQLECLLKRAQEPEENRAGSRHDFHSPRERGDVGRGWKKRKRSGGSGFIRATR